MSNLQANRLIIDDKDRGIFRVHRSVFTDPSILELEQTLIFNKFWLYLGHESEVKKPGDFVTRTVAGRPLFFVRGKDNLVHAFYNTCPHRGATVCRHDKGNAAVFQCFYHGWTFDNSGALVGLPDQAAYSQGFDKKEMGLETVPRLVSYRGFIFVSFNERVADLETYLGGAKDALDLLADQSLSGSMIVVGGEHRYSIKANWKLLAENSIDNYHTATVHDTYFQYVRGIGAEMSHEGIYSSDKGCTVLGNGHSMLNYAGPWGRPVLRWAPIFGKDSKAQIEALYKKYIAKYGEERASRICNGDFNLFVFPNFVIVNTMGTTLRTFYPLSPDVVQVYAWLIAPEEELKEMFTRRLHSFLDFLGPGGFGTPDDIEALELCQIGYHAGGDEWNDISKGMKRKALTTDELQIRSFWRQWDATLTQTTRTDWSD